MRRKDKGIPSRREIDAIIHGCDVSRLALAVENEPYMVPVSFGYDGAALFFHTAQSGKKIEFLESNNKVCFEFERNVRLQTSPDVACKWTFAFESVIVEDLIVPVDDLARYRGLAIIRGRKPLVVQWLLS